MFVWVQRLELQPTELAILVCAHNILISAYLRTHSAITCTPFYASLYLYPGYAWEILKVQHRQQVSTYLPPSKCIFVLHDFSNS